MAHSTTKVAARAGRARRIAAAAVIAVSAAVLGSCGLQSGGAVPLSVNPGSIEPIPELEGVKLTVGSKDFTENQLIAEMYAELVSTLIIDRADEHLKDAVEARGLKCVVTDTLMSRPDVAAQLARTCLDAEGGTWEQNSA